MRDPNLPRRGAFLALLLLAGCVPAVKGVGIRDLDLDLPASYGVGGDAPSVGIPRDPLFEDPYLVSLIEEALANNRELGLATQEINLTSAEIIGRRGAVFPQVGLGVDAGVEKVGRYTSQGASDASDEMTPGHEVPENLGDFRIALRASWEIDIWKKLRSATQAARARYLASVEGRDFVITGLVAEIANTYYELEALDRQIGVVQSTIDILGEAVEAVKLQQQAARVTSLAVQRFEAELHKVESRRFALQQRSVETENRLNLLVGRFPQHVDRSTDRFLDLSLEPMDAGVPSQLLERRPDIRAAELELQAAKLDVKVARAEFFPTVAVDARFGIEAFDPTKLAAMPASLLYEVAAGLLAPLINRSAINAEYQAANARQMQALLEYEQTVLLAVVDVANQVSAIDNTDQGYAARRQQVDQLRLAIDTSNLLFQSARADFLEVLTTRSEALEAELELVEARQRQLAARIDLYRALGGGWEPTVTTSLAPVSTNPSQGEG